MSDATHLPENTHPTDTFQTKSFLISQQRTMLFLAFVHQALQVALLALKHLFSGKQIMGGASRRHAGKMDNAYEDVQDFCSSRNHKRWLMKTTSLLRTQCDLSYRMKGCQEFGKALDGRVSSLVNFVLQALPCLTLAYVLSVA